MFEGTGHAMAQSWGVPEYRFLSMPHPIANLSEADLDARAREIAPEVVRLLLKGQESQTGSLDGCPPSGGARGPFLGPRG